MCPALLNSQSSKDITREQEEPDHGHAACAITHSPVLRRALCLALLSVLKF